MTITSTSIGANTVQITTSGTGSLFTDLFLAVKNAITGVSPVKTTTWTLLDEFDAGTIHTQVFKSLNKDGTTYKNIILRWNTYTRELNTSCCESWNATTHVPTNECYTFFDCSPVSFNLSNTDIILFISPRWCALSSLVGNEPGLWAGVFELLREDSADVATPSYPCWGWVSALHAMLGTNSSLTLGTPTKNLGNNDYTLLSMPRTRDGSTGINAAKKFAANYGYQSYPNWLQSSSPFVHYLSNLNSKLKFTLWDGSYVRAYQIKPIHGFDQNSITPYGTICGLKAVSPVGSNLNKVVLPIDSDGNSSDSGTATDHWVLNNCHKPTEWEAGAWFPNTGWTVASATLLSGVTPVDMCSIGSFYYVVTTAGKVVKVNSTSLSSSEIGANLAGTSGTNIVYDGERYVYVGSSNGLVRIDTTNDSYISLPCCAGGVRTISVSPLYITCTPRTTSSNVVVRFLRSATFNVTTISAGNVTIPVNEISSIALQLVNSDGNTLITYSTLTNLGNAVLFKITGASTVTSATLTLNSTYTNGCLVPINDTNALLVCHSTAAGVARTIQFNPKTLAQIANLDTAGNLSGTVADTVSNAIKVAGTLLIAPRNSATASILAFLNLNAGVSSTLPIPVVGADQSATTGQSTSMMLFSDGTKVIVGTTTGIRVFGNINGNSVTSGVTLGQYLIPA